MSLFGDQTPSTAEHSQDPLQHSISFLGLPAYIASSIFPGVLQAVERYPRLVKALSLPFAAYWITSYAAGKIKALLQYLMSHFTSSVTISAADVNLLAAFRRFVETKHLLLPERDLTAHSTAFIQNQALNHGVNYNKKLLEGQSINFEPWTEFQIFRHHGRFFFITSNTLAQGSQQVPGLSQLTACKLWCLGWSPKPIKDLVMEVYNTQCHLEKLVMTTIYAPTDRASWSMRCIRARRPLKSVYFDHEKKAEIVNEINDYLSISTAKWYSERGIPYRRGFLFHGQTGTGKTSLALALAGHFKLDVYILSLLDPHINDGVLQILFQALRPGVIILLEDIDPAGLNRENKSQEDPFWASIDNKNSASVEVDDMDERQMREILKKQKEEKKQPRKSNVTLSGLLNAIDGAGAPEGHLLILTTNKPENLDEALVRAGRVDVRVKFEFASKSQIKDIFVNMYRPRQEKGWSKDEKKEENYKTRVKELKQMAKEFARKVPTRALSPAQLQDYILTKKTKPEQAIEDVQAWMMREYGVAEGNVENIDADVSEEASGPSESSEEGESSD